MRLIPFLFAALITVVPIASHAAGAATSVRAIAFVASNEKGATDSRLAPYEGVLRSNLRYESFKYAGESSGAVAPGERSNMSLPNGGSVVLEGDNSGAVKVHRGGTVVTVSPGRPAVFMAGPAGKGEASGVIVMTN